MALIEWLLMGGSYGVAQNVVALFAVALITWNRVVVPFSDLAQMSLPDPAAILCVLISQSLIP